MESESIETVGVDPSFRAGAWVMCKDGKQHKIELCGRHSVLEQNHRKSPSDSRKERVMGIEPTSPFHAFEKLRQ